jgi:hypothetical protein
VPVAPDSEADHRTLLLKLSVKKSLGTHFPLSRGATLRAFHFISEDLRSDEDMIAGNSVPWRIAETRAFTPVAIDAGNQEIVSEIGYRSSPTLWDAFLQADGPVACLVEVSEVLSVVGDVDAGLVQLSGTRRLLMAREIGAELRSFASDCAERVLHLYEREFSGDDRPRGAIQLARDYARGRVGATELRAALVLAKNCCGRIALRKRRAMCCAVCLGQRRRSGSGCCRSRDVGGELGCGW